MIRRFFSSHIFSLFSNTQATFQYHCDDTHFPPLVLLTADIFFSDSRTFSFFLRRGPQFKVIDKAKHLMLCEGREGIMRNSDIFLFCLLQLTHKWKNRKIRLITLLTQPWEICHIFCIPSQFIRQLFNDKTKNNIFILISPRALHKPNIVLANFRLHCSLIFCTEQ